MPEVGQIIEPGRVPNERIETVIEQVESGGFTSETVVMTITAPLVGGRIYKVRFAGGFNTDGAADDRMFARIREDSLAGAQLQGLQLIIPNTSGAVTIAPMEVEHTAASTADKTFVVTGQLVGGTGPLHLGAGTVQPAYLYVDYIRG